jgi:hypothetical protein
MTACQLPRIHSLPNRGSARKQRVHDPESKRLAKLPEVDSGPPPWNRASLIAPSLEWTSYYKIGGRRPSTAPLNPGMLGSTRGPPPS